ncbi:hypothetical protein HO173_005610 [Letharia columbiana]|uniref:Uncharacterized protein n=1 Tax=Letharia columbiana TaxID=112416 RepID=A0A8H6FWF8_9LECA|nr:uncharacterized protein HO173_005610 [Letharia columbiana]KAF6235982.1 hypothetical protein HO173_005610 [Letharia columbiana]
MENNNWLGKIIGFLSIFVLLTIFRYHLKIEIRQELEQALETQKKPRTARDIFNEYKNNPGHKFLTRSERRFREHQLRKHLKQTWNQEQSLTHTNGTEPVRRENPAVKEFSRMNRQLRQPSPQKSPFSHLLHLLFIKLCIYTALPFLTLSIFCHSLRISLTASLLLEVEEESEDVGELDSV